MKVLALISSTMKKGLGATLTKELCSVIPAGKAEIEYVYLYDLNYKSCGDCESDSDLEGFCSKRDDLVPVLQKLIEADVVVWSMPIYLDYMCGTAKTFFDRFCIFVNPDFTINRIPGKKFALIMTCGTDCPEEYNGVMKSVSDLLTGFFKCEVLGSLIATTRMKPLSELTDEYHEQARNLGKLIASL